MVTLAYLARIGILSSGTLSGGGGGPEPWVPYVPPPGNTLDFNFVENTYVAPSAATLTFSFEET